MRWSAVIFVFFFVCAGLCPAQEPLFALKGDEQPTVGSVLSLASDVDVSEYTFKWIKGDALGTFDEETVLSDASSYTISEADYEHWLRIVVYDNAGEPVFARDTWISKLPVLYIETEDGNPVTTKEYYVTANLRIQGNEEYEQQYLGKTQIKGRGTSSWSTYPQKPYKLKLDKKTTLFGFGKSRHWVLISNFNDKCALRNYVASQLAKELGIIGMEMTWVDVVLNGEVKGCYMLSQQVRVDKNSVDIFDWEEEAESVANSLFATFLEEGVDMGSGDIESLADSMKQNLSWVTEGNVLFDVQLYNLSNYDLKKEYNIRSGYLYEARGKPDVPTFFETPKGVKIGVRTPEFLFTNNEMLTYATGLWLDFEAECCLSPPSKGKDFTQYADMESMIGIWLVNEFMGQGDPTNSRFSYVPDDGKLHFGPAWDFDHSSACWSTSSGTNSFYTLVHKKAYSYFQYWFPDPILCEMAYETYWEVARPFIVDYLSSKGEMNGKYAFIKEACETNDILWGTYPSELHPSAEPRTAEEDYAELRTFLNGHLDWLDKQFESVETLIASMNDICPYPYSLTTDTTPRKVIKDNKIYILWEGRMYSLDGKRVWRTDT